MALRDKVRIESDQTVTGQTLERMGLTHADPLTFVASDARAFARTLANKPVKIQFLTKKDFAGATDGKTIWIDGNIAQDESMPLTERADIVKGALLDELGHILWTKHTPTQCVAMYANRRDSSLPYVPNLAMGVVNLVEDHYIVRRLLRQFPGFKKTHFATLNHYINTKERIAQYHAEIVTQGVPTLESVTAMLIIMVKGSIRLDGADGLNAIADKFELVHKMHKHESRVDLAIDITNQLLATYMSDPKSTAENVEQDQDDQDQNDDPTDAQDQPQPQDLPQPMDDEDETAEPMPMGDDDEDELDDADQGDDPIEADNSDSTPDLRDEFGGEDEDEDWDDDWDEDDSDVDENDEDLDEVEDWDDDDDDEDDIEQIDADGDLDDEDLELTDEPGDPSAVENTGADESGDGDEESEEDIIEADVKDTPNTSADQGDGSQDTYEPTFNDIEDQDADLDEILVNGGMGETTAMDEVDHTRETDTTDQVKVEYDKIAGSHMRVTYNPNPVNRKTKSMPKWDRQVALQLSKRLKLTATDEGGWTHGYRSGRILPRDIVKVARGSRTPASRFNSRQMPNLAVAILQDASGSINKTDHSMICRLCDIVIEGMDKANKGLKVWHMAYEGRNITVTKEPGKVRKVSSRQASDPGGGTPTVEAILKATELMELADPTARKMIIVITDGSPNSVKDVSGAYVNGNAAIHTFAQENRQVELMQVLVNAWTGADITHTIKVDSLNETSIVRLVTTLNAAIKATRRQRD